MSDFALGMLVGTGCSIAGVVLGYLARGGLVADRSLVRRFARNFAGGFVAGLPLGFVIGLAGYLLLALWATRG